MFLVNFSITVWKFHNFSTTQILREINFEETRYSKTAILGTLDFVNLVLSLQKVQKFRLSQCVEIVEWESRFANFDFT